MTKSLREGWIKGGFTKIAEWVRPERGIQEKQVSDYYKALLRKMDSDNSGDLSGAELSYAVNYAELDVRDIAARLGVKHDSEWFAGSSHLRWRTFLKQLDPLCISYVKKWFDDMEWMSKVEGFSSGESVWHMHPVIFLNALSDGEEMITYEQLKAMFPADKENYVEIYLEPLNETMKLFEINTPLRKAHFMAQILHETGFFKYTEEIASGKAYECRSDLGNNQVGDGPLFRP